MSTYLQLADMKTTLEIENESYADDDITRALEAASRVIDAYKGTRFYPTSETRKYTADNCDDTLQIYELNNTAGSTVSFDMDGDGTYETVLVRGTDFEFDPQDNDLTNKPWNAITLLAQGGKQWPQWRNGVEVQGSFGWATAPGQVAEACSILASRYLKRARETPYGIVTVGVDALAVARLGKIDPDVAFLLDEIYDDETPLLIL